ncbi:MAG TPA: lysylphosphatidylglycerol synthase domain-containing protein [Gemmatimonadales bacterium]|nr:lysylphosphatidylglycerol synthase domain-containing protein [Gemmatimonadales bacterium]
MKRYRWLFWAIAAISAVFAVRYAARFPWTVTVDSLRHASWLLLALAGAASLGSVVAKGWAWHVLLRPAWRHRWVEAQAATVAGAAVSAVSVSISGEAARLQALAGRGDPPLSPLMSSIVWSRITEAIALAVFLAGSLVLLPPARWIRTARIAAAVVLALVGLLWLSGIWRRLVARLPSRWQHVAGLGAVTGTPPLPLPVALGVANWALQWLAYHLSIVSVGIVAPPGAALAALVAANLGGILRLTPGNVGVLQASIVMGLLPFGVTADRALAAGLALQAVQVLPVLLAGALVAGRAAWPWGAKAMPPVSTSGAGSGADSGTGGSEG